MKAPNIIILNPDEMRADSMGHMGNPAAHTPHLDDFAAQEAVSFENAFCQNPVCVPSRCSFLTGLYPHVNGHRTMNHLLHENEKSLFRELKEAGYYVWMNSRNDLVAGQIEGLAESHADEIYYYDKSKPVPKIPLDVLKGNMGGAEREHVYSHYEGIKIQAGGSDLDDTRAACERILNPVEPEKPLCLFLGWTNPHPPYTTTETYRRLINDSKIPKRIRYEETEGKSRIIGRLKELTGMQDYKETQWKELRATYLAQCAMIDELFSMVCDALKEAGEYENSAIFFLSDHGDFTGDYGLPEKCQNSFEHCLTRVPLLIKPPSGEDVDPGTAKGLAELVDFYATVMDYAGVKPGHTQFGISLRPVIADRKRQLRKFVFCEGGRNPGEVHCDEFHVDGPSGPPKTNVYWPRMTVQAEDEAHEKGTMIFDGRYKYIRRPSGRDEFYDLASDPGERFNIVGKISKERLAVYQSEMLDWYQRTCDIVPFTYDSRFTFERVWAVCRSLCPEGEEKRVQEAIREGMGIQQAVEYCIMLHNRSGKSMEREP